MRALRGILALAGLAALLALALAGCSHKTAMRGNAPPETVLFVRGVADTVAVDTTDHHVHLYWFGSDPDGEVTRYEWRFLTAGQPLETPWDTTGYDSTIVWGITTLTDRVFTVHDAGGVVVPVFQVRAVDDQGAPDPTPATQKFAFHNDQPTVSFAGAPVLPDTTFPTATVAWTAYDNDGDINQMTFLIWLDGKESAPLRITQAGQRSANIPSDYFRTPGGAFAGGSRTIYLQGIDDGGLASDVVSYTWYVRKPVAGAVPRLLLVDDLPFVYDPQGLIDSLYYNSVARSVKDTSYAVLNLERVNPFRSAADVVETFKLFDAVLWYRDKNPGFSTLLQTYQGAIEDYLRIPGKSVFLQGSNLIDGMNSSGPLTFSFARDFLGCDSLYTAPVPAPEYRQADWDVRSGRQVRSFNYGDPALSDTLSLKAQKTGGGARAFAVQDTHFVAFWADPGALTPANTERFPVVLDVPQPGGGRAILFTFTIRDMDGFGNAYRVLQKALDRMGVANQ